MSSDQFVVSHAGDVSLLHRVCIVDMEGHIIKSYGGERGSGDGQLCYPRDLAVDRYGNVLVADYYSSKVML